MERVLITEDDPRLAALFENGLRANGYATALARNGDSALDAVLHGAFALLVLDLDLAVPAGITAPAALRAAAPELPVIALHAPFDEVSAARAFDYGANELLAKPFAIAQLLDRIRARLVHRGRPIALTLQAGDATLDFRNHTVTIPSGRLDLTPREFGLAELLFRHPGQALSRQQLLRYAWRYDFDPRSNVVDVYVGYLRRKLGRRRIRSVRGVGYRLATSPEPNGVD